MSAENKKTEPSCSASKTKPERTKRASGTDFVREALATGDEAYTAFGEGVLGSREAATWTTRERVLVEGPSAGRG